MYIVVFKPPTSDNPDDRTRAEFNDKATFESWHNAEMKDLFEVVEEGVTKGRADELCPVGEDLVTSSRFHPR